jgi:nitrite reductase/ring-hydroxylating ferredoxin subunit
MKKVHVCHASEVPPGGMQAFEADGEPILIANVAGRFYAIGNECTHAHAELSEGYLDENECTVECPLHNAVFSLESGDALESPAELPVPTYAVLLEGEDLYIELPSK